MRELQQLAGFGIQPLGIFMFICWSIQLSAQHPPHKFQQLEYDLPTPNEVRTGSGAPGEDYWQQQADYQIDVELDDKSRQIIGSEIVTYINNSPDKLSYIWFQLDQNIWDKNSDTYATETGTVSDPLSFDQLAKLLEQQQFDGGYKIGYVSDYKGNKLPYTINKTMMRVDLPKPLEEGESIAIKIGWKYNINDQRKHGGRTGYEYFPQDDNTLYEIAHWFPRVAVYTDNIGWNHKQFLGRGEFALTFGNYKVNITVPADFVVASTGELKNPTAVLTPAQMERLKTAAQRFDKPVLIITPDEAKANESSRRADKRTWKFEATNVRDFAFAASRKFIWDAMACDVAGYKVMCMSYYPKEGNPLWEQYSTASVAHTLRVYSKFSVNYTYPVAISVNGPVGGMEYPMICFNGPRPESDGTYTEGTKIGLISVVIHEVGHNFFPMIINSDERQWTWMDEGLNSFVQFLAEQEWDRNYPPRRGPAHKIVDFMRADKGSGISIMTNSESIVQFGNNAYGKPAAALNILRETVMGRELFDFAFKTYCERWAFKHPTPPDFFRTMEDASGVDLDWFWRGWFYTTDNVDIAIKEVQYFQPSSMNPAAENQLAKAARDESPKTITYQRNLTDNPTTLVERQPELNDFYNRYDPLETTIIDRNRYQNLVESLTEQEKKLLQSNLHLYQISFENIGGLVMPLILQFHFSDGTKVIKRIPAEVWRYNTEKINKVFLFEKPVERIQLDPFLETADVNTDNNSYPPKSSPSRLELFKQKPRDNMNPMQIQRKIEEFQQRNRD
jgi:hypothetical protein